PNAISVAGMFAGLFAGLALWSTARYPDSARVFFVVGAVLVQLRLLANMLDGMVAVATQKTTPVGELYNEIPDRVSDVAILLGLGYSLGGHVELGWAASVAAVLTAYVRAQVKVAGAPQDFCGPMAKPHRMFAVTVTALYCAVSPGSWQVLFSWGVPTLCLAIVTIGSLGTALRRLLRGARALRAVGD
ncbi:MAG: CDP-alcohol phosphatidyltransferase family protein, partial [Planctomycetes bacterium]|nr:CDP-alcohol phosphatidyltransferase family protein [Planctomycetota bacterium]